MTTKNEPGAVVGMPKEPHPEITPTQALKQPLEFNEQTSKGNANQSSNLH
jgi:hypothetical protein